MTTQRVLVVADAHFDHWGQAGPHPLEALTRSEWDGLDALILAGDVANKGHVRWKQALAWLGDRIDPPKTWIFPGNHDYYGGDYLDRDDKLREVAEGAGAPYAQKAEIRMPGRRFLCCTLWTDMKLGGDLQLAEWRAEEQMNDYRLIRISRDGYRKARPRDTRALHLVHRTWLEERLADPYEGATTVVTHHAPHPRSLGLFGLGSVSACYASDLTVLIERHQPDDWLHGHTHIYADYDVGRTRLRCVSIGYPTGDGSGQAPGIWAGLIEW